MTIQRAALFADVLDVKERAAGNGKARFVASTANPARSDRSIIDQASWKLDGYQANSVVLKDHEYEVDSITGRGVATVEQGRLMLDVTWAPSAAGVLCRELYEGGFLNAVSVGFIPGRMTRRSELPKEHPYYTDVGWSYVYFDCELIEVSMVAVGDDASALAEREGASVEVRGVSDVSGLIDSLVTDGRFARAVAAALTASGVVLTPAPAPGGSGVETAPTGGLSFFRKG